MSYDWNMWAINNKVDNKKKSYEMYFQTFQQNFASFCVKTPFDIILNNNNNPSFI